MLSQIIVADVDPAAVSEFLSSWAKRVSPGTKAFGADFSKAMADACARDGSVSSVHATDHVLIKADRGYYLERGQGSTMFASKAHRFERGDAEKIIAQDREFNQSIAIVEIPVAPKAAAPARSPDDFVLIQNSDSDEYFLAIGLGTTKDISEAHRYSRRYAEDYVGVWHLRIVEIAPTRVDPLAARIAELERDNADLRAANGIMQFAIKNYLAA